jgi:phosphate transport system substrate-binding protein
LITSSQNNVDNLTLEQVSDIFTGKITNWKEVGGEDAEIACIGREAGSGTRDGFESITKTSDSCKLSQELTSTGAVLTAVASSKNAIGYASLSTVESKTDIKKISIDGVECTEQTVIDSTYKIQRPFNIIVSQDKELSSTAQDFLDFCLSNSVSSIIEKAGAIPVNK